MQRRVSWGGKESEREGGFRGGRGGEELHLTLRPWCHAVRQQRERAAAELSAAEPRCTARTLDFVEAAHIDSIDVLEEPAATAARRVTIRGAPADTLTRTALGARVASPLVRALQRFIVLRRAVARDPIAMVVIVPAAPVAAPVAPVGHSGLQTSRSLRKEFEVFSLKKRNLYVAHEITNKAQELCPFKFATVGRPRSAQHNGPGLDGVRFEALVATHQHLRNGPPPCPLVRVRPPDVCPGPSAPSPDLQPRLGSL